MSTKKILEAYQKCVNDIDDFLEYLYSHYTKEEIRAFILNHINTLTRDLRKVKND